MGTWNANKCARAAKLGGQLALCGVLSGYILIRVWNWFGPETALPKFNAYDCNLPLDRPCHYTAIG